MVETNNINANKFDTLQKARKDLVGEIEAVIEYDNHAQSATDNLSKQTWLHIKEDELTHVGELLGLINEIDPSQFKFIEKGLKEFEERKEKSFSQNTSGQSAGFYNRSDQKECNNPANNNQSRSFNCGLNLFNRVK